MHRGAAPRHLDRCPNVIALVSAALTESKPFLTHGEWVMSILTFIYVVISAGSLWAIRKQAKIADKAAQAALINAQAVIATERALVVPKLYPLGRKKTDGRWYREDGTPYTTEETLLGKHMLHALRITNVGRTPAHILSFQIGYTCLLEGVTDISPDTSDDLVERSEFDYLLAGGQTIEMLAPVDILEKMASSWTEIRERKKTAIFRGWVKYRHIFSETEECQSDYCYDFSVDSERLSSVGRHTHYA